MGALSSRQVDGVEELDVGVNHTYRYPSKTGTYFSSHFIMGGERFDMIQPENYLFGENADLNFLGSQPSPFPYPAPASGEPSRCLKAQVNIRKETLRFVRLQDDIPNVSVSTSDTEIVTDHPVTAAASRFNVEFVLDCDVACSVRLMYFCTEEVTPNGLVYTSRNPGLSSEPYHFKRGANQLFCQPEHVFEPSLYSEEHLLYNFDLAVIPVVIYCVVEEGEEPKQAHVTYGMVEKHTEGYILKPLKQKLFVDGLCYLLQEIYGIENKIADVVTAPVDEDTDDNGSECVICMCDLRDTLILPCRHLCLCSSCADSLRYQANNCPICRAPFRALLQVKALQKSLEGTVSQPENVEGGDNIPPGYQLVTLIEALNGPNTAPAVSVPPTADFYVQLPLNELSLGDKGSRADSSKLFRESITVRSLPGVMQDTTSITIAHDMMDTVKTELPCSRRRKSFEDEGNLGGDRPTVSAGKRKSACRKTSRDRQQFGSRDSVKLVDPAETRSLLDEENDPSSGGESRCSPSPIRVKGEVKVVTENGEVEEGCLVRVLTLDGTNNELPTMPGTETDSSYRTLVCVPSKVLSMVSEGESAERRGLREGDLTSTPDLVVSV